MPLIPYLHSTRCLNAKTKSCGCWYSKLEQNQCTQMNRLICVCCQDQLAQTRPQEARQLPLNMRIKIHMNAQWGVGICDHAWLILYASVQPVTERFRVMYLTYGVPRDINLGVFKNIFTPNGVNSVHTRYHLLMWLWVACTSTWSLFAWKGCVHPWGVDQLSEVSVEYKRNVLSL